MIDWDCADSNLAKMDSKVESGKVSSYSASADAMCAVKQTNARTLRTKASGSLRLQHRAEGMANLKVI